MASLMLDFTVPGGMADIAKAAPRVLLSLGADEMDYSPFSEQPTRSISATTATRGWRITPTSSCRAHLMPKRTGLYVNTEGRVQFAEKGRIRPR